MKTNHISLFPNEHFLDIRPYQYGWEECQPLHSFGPFVRNHYLLHHIISGQGMLFSHTTTGEIHEYNLEADQTFLICPGQVNMYTADETIMSKAQMLAKAGIQSLHEGPEIQNNQTDDRRRHHKPAPSLLPSCSDR